jgi:predicted secreted protein
MKKQVGTTTDQLITGLLIVILFSCSVLAVVCPSARAAGLWSETYGGINDDRALSLVATLDGGYTIAGTTDSFGAGGYDFWLVKTDADGNMQWDNTYNGGGSSEHAYSLVQTGDGEYALAGFTNSVAEGGETDFWLVKTDSTGNQLWSRTYGGAGNEEAHSLVQTDDGEYMIAGYTDSLGAGGYDFWLVKTERVSDSSTFMVLLIVVIAVAVVCFGLIVYFIKIKKKAQLLS